MEFRRVIKESQSNNDAPRNVYPDDFPRILSKIAVAQVCQGVGFDCVKQSALEALSNVVVQYISDLGILATSYATLGRRTECNVFDIVKGLEELGCSCESAGGSVKGLEELGCSCKCADESVDSSSVIKEISQFVGMVENIPFAQPIPQFPVVEIPRLIISFSDMGESLSHKHIPGWLPAFPDRHTYKQSLAWNERKNGVKDEKGKQRRRAARTLMNLQRRWLSHGLTPCSEYMCLSPPLSARETFASLIDALKGGALDLDRRVASERRPVAYFKLKAGKKLLIEDLDVHLRSSGTAGKKMLIDDLDVPHLRSSGKTGNVRKRTRFQIDGDKDYKKWRVEQILGQSLEYNQE